jgi:hypothetical protein
MKNKDKTGNHKFELAISILVHENCEFVNLQFKNIRKFYPNALVVVHVSEFFWKFEKNEITKYADNYNVIINPQHIKTGWSTPSIFKAIISNQLILNTYSDWTHYIFLSSNELFYKNKFEDVFKFGNQDFEFPKIYQFHENLYRFNPDAKNFEEREFDINYLEILKNYNSNIFVYGLDFGRLMNRKSFNLILNLILKYNFNQDQISLLKRYTQSELIIPTFIYLLELDQQLIIEKNIHFVYWPSEYEIANSSKEIILFKHVNRNIHDSFVKRIMKDNGMHYKTNIFQYLSSLFPEIKRRISNNLNKYFA